MNHPEQSVANDKSSSANLRFLVTIDLSRLARWLRTLGLDTVIAKSTEKNYLKIICNLQNRILLTRIRRSEKLPAVKRFLLISSKNHKDQLIQVIKELDIRNFRIFSRCLYCNQSVQPVAKVMILSKLPEKVKEREEHFTRCPKCRRIYWAGMHFQAIMQFLAAVSVDLNCSDLGEFVLTEFN